MNAPLPSSTQRAQRAADQLGLAIHVREMPQSTRTAEDAAAACDCAVEQIVKSLVFQGATSGEPYLLLVSGKNRVDQNGVAQSVGEALTRPDAAQVRAWTGYAIGGIPPFGHDTVMRTFIDHDLLTHSVVWAAAGTPQTVFSVEPNALAQAVQAVAISVS
ncbi:YbaK/EbsC family protein [Microvirga alba]|uniref:YbaK/EbsC family protein n=1 Tax=Microvirga alba TaxID=2791025 RepID=A0A931FQ99_9HYPH|nr:YbaK/EbsC family protein [Microvirga alba]MBF9234382.1 YbaK/EbsC family protein [Microvirga alba]